MRFLCAAFGREIGKKDFFAVNIKKAKEAGFIEKFHHFSSLHADGRSVIGRLCCEPLAKAIIMRCLERCVVDMINHTQLCSFTESTGPDVLVISIDSGVGDIIFDVRKNGSKPRILYFSTIGMHNSEINQIESVLSPDYNIVAFEDHSIAYESIFYREYCESLFIDYGIPTVFSRAMGVIATESDVLLKPIRIDHQDDAEENGDDNG